MQRLILIVLLGALGWYGDSKYQAKLASVEAGSGSAVNGRPLLRQGNLPDASGIFLRWSVVRSRLAQSSH